MSLAKLPTKVGEIELEYSDRQFGLPIRNGSKLTLSHRSGMEVHVLKNETQFLVLYPGKKLTPQQLLFTFSNVPQLCDGRAFFGGMDDSPFITSLEDPAVLAFKKGGEAGLFDSLTPLQVKILQQKFPEAKILRQGDVWSLKLPVSWEKLRQAIIPEFVYKKPSSNCPRIRERINRQNKIARQNYCLKQGQLAFLLSNKSRIPVFGAQRHVIEGVGGRLQLNSFDNSFGKAKWLVVEGVLTAPDHPTHELFGGPHIIMRTPHLTSMKVLPLLNGD